MPYDEQISPSNKTHELNMKNREKLSLTGVTDISGFDESMIVLTTAQGDLTIRGIELHIGKIDLDVGQLEVRGHIQELSYDEPVQSGSLWTKLFG